MVAEQSRIGRPARWAKEDVLRSVYHLCKGRYVKARDFPSYLYKLCNKFCGGVRSAKWEAKVIHGRSWDYEKFIKWVAQFAKKKYREDKDWPARMRTMAKRFCGSIRKAKWEAGVIHDPRTKKRRRVDLNGLWSKKRFIEVFREHCRYGYHKPGQLPGYLRAQAVRHFGTVRAAKWETGLLRDPRNKKR
ncbi:MAG: hypothetical protein A2902_03620 [Elusimicrobia bacterium RIFCSPLOWO2_01_FULL_64_13]|nr:MAG: hypothetical protein A2902_03620 [Elusimicrobia bacterium RIFCSPLOWO2_01_FULL_64_13]